MFRSAFCSVPARSVSVSVSIAVASLAASMPARGQTRKLDDDAPVKAAAQNAGAALGSLGTYVPPPIVVKGRTYSLDECLALADRNHPNIWAARARLSFVHGQLDEATWTPFWQWNASATTGLIGQIGGTPQFSQSTISSLTPSFGRLGEPFVQLSISGGVPLYTFGKITAAKGAAESQVRANEWDLEKARQQVRWDVRRAFFGLMLARDVHYLIDDIRSRLEQAISGMRAKIAKGDTSVAEWDKLRLEIYREEIVARLAEADKGATQAITGLRFLTGIQTAFDIPDEPLKRPDVPVASVVQYLSTARLFRPETNMARAGILARKYWADYQRARLFPDIALGLQANYAAAPSAVLNTNAWLGIGFNGFAPVAVLRATWNLDLLPQAARIAQAEAQHEETRAQERLSLGGVAVEVEHAYAAVLEAKTREEAWDRAEHKSKAWIAMIQDAIDLGAQDERALMEPLRAFANSRSSHLIAMMDFNVQMCWLAFVSGWDAAAPHAT
jgi:outer membrane protein, multidrug efflux system